MAIDLIDQVRALHGRKGSYLFPKYGDPDKFGPMSRHVLSRYDYMAEKRAAAERSCDFLEVTISTGNVVPMRKSGEAGFG